MTQAAKLLIVVFDSSKARIFKPAPEGRIRPITEVESGLHHFTRDEVSDRPGRSFSSIGNIRHAYEPKHDPHNYDKHEFVHQLARMLDHSYELGEFGNLMIVAPKRSLGEFHKLATEKLRRSVSREVAKDLVKLSEHELEKRLRPYLEAVR